MGSFFIVANARLPGGNSVFIYAQGYRGIAQAENPAGRGVPPRCDEFPVMRRSVDVPWAQCTHNNV